MVISRCTLFSDPMTCCAVHAVLLLCLSPSLPQTKQHQAGQTVDLFYNPDLTPLRGRPLIQAQGGFNRYGNDAAVLVLGVALFGFTNPCKHLQHNVCPHVQQN